MSADAAARHDGTYNLSFPLVRTRNVFALMRQVDGLFYHVYNPFIDILSITVAQSIFRVVPGICEIAVS